MAVCCAEGLVSPAFNANKENDSNLANKSPLQTVGSQGEGGHDVAPHQGNAPSVIDQNQSASTLPAKQQQPQAVLAVTRHEGAAVTCNGQISAASPGTQNTHRMLASAETTASAGQPSPPNNAKQEAEVPAGPLHAPMALENELLPASLLCFNQEWAASVSSRAPRPATFHALNTILHRKPKCMSCV